MGLVTMMLERSNVHLNLLCVEYTLSVPTDPLVIPRTIDKFLLSRYSGFGVLLYQPDQALAEYKPEPIFCYSCRYHQAPAAGFWRRKSASVVDPCNIRPFSWPKPLNYRMPTAVASNQRFARR